ncbi:MAG: hypothetical protein JWO19_1178 [Bryobacterales bacterium]|nr:hypothetical protein [Bryobacterales bacterium]
MAISMSRKAHFGRIDRRNDSRIICEGAAVIDVLSPQPRSSVEARILDVGETSLKLNLPFFLSPGSLIRIHMTDSVANAEVRYCTCESVGYNIGVRIEDITPKSV